MVRLELEERVATKSGESGEPLRACWADWVRWGPLRSRQRMKRRT
jgi:hypothetical protein